jgi:hypothetical protein
MERRFAGDCFETKGRSVPRVDRRKHDWDFAAGLGKCRTAGEEDGGEGESGCTEEYFPTAG